MPTRPKRKKIKQEPKTCPLTIMMSEGEMALLNSYLGRKGIHNRSAFVRRVVMNKVLSEISGNPVSLFEASQFPHE